MLFCLQGGWCLMLPKRMGCNLYTKSREALKASFLNVMCYYIKGPEQKAL